MVPTTSGCPTVSDENDLPAQLVVAGHLHVNLRDQGARRIDDEHLARPRVGRNGLGNAVCRKDHGLSRIWYLVQLFHKNGAFRPQGINNITVVYDFMTDVDGSAEFQSKPVLRFELRDRRRHRNRVAQRAEFSGLASARSLRLVKAGHGRTQFLILIRRG